MDREAGWLVRLFFCSLNFLFKHILIIPEFEKRDCPALRHIYLNSIREGNLALTMPGNEEIKTKVTRIDDFWFGSGYISDQANELANELKTSTALPNVVENLSNRLGTQDTFVLSGGGYLFMKNPIFNKDADLLARLEFNGVSGR